MAKNKLPNLLSFTRSIVPSNGVFYYLDNHQQKQPILIDSQTVRGTISNYSNVYKKTGQQENEANIEKKLNPENANIQTIDICYLPSEIEHYYLDFSISFLNNSMTADSCNDAEFAKKIEALTQEYAQKGGYEELAKLYLTNIVNGRWLWRNRYASEKSVSLQADSSTEKHTFKINAFKPELNAEQQAIFDGIAKEMAKAFTGEREPYRLNVTATGKIGKGQEVYPSQEFIEGKKGKFLAFNKVAEGKQAIMHSQKIGNAIRTIDTWYPEYEGEPLAIEPYGVMQQRSKAFRLPNTKTDLYTYLQNLDDLQKKIDGVSSAEEMDNSLHYTIACLIRGGVYSGAAK